MTPFIFIKTAGQLQPGDLYAKLDDREVEITLSSDGIFIYADNVFGLHKLSLIAVKSVRVEILQCFVNGCSLRKLLYLSWMENSQHEKFQPGTIIWEAGQSWHLPFGSPVSYWIELVESKFPNRVLGGNLYDDYFIYYPDNMILDSSRFPNTVTDFFLHNFNFTVVPKQTVTVEQIPYMQYKKIVPQELLELTGQEVVKNVDHNTNESYTQRTQNLQEFGNNFNSNWSVTWLYKQGKKLPLIDDYPHVQALIDFLDLDCWSVFIGKLSPGDFIYPHVDDLNKSKPEYLDYQGCTQLYIPLIWPAGNFIKIASVGILPMENGLMVINNDTFTHSVVNTGNQPRYALGLRVHKKILNDCVIN